MDPSVGCGCQRFGGLGRSSSIGGIHSADALRPAAAMEGAPTPCPGAVVSTPLTQEACDALCRRHPTAYATKCFSKRSETLFSCDLENKLAMGNSRTYFRSSTHAASVCGWAVVLLWSGISRLSIVRSQTTETAPAYQPPPYRVCTIDVPPMASCQVNNTDPFVLTSDALSLSVSHTHTRATRLARSPGRVSVVSR
jgi:hypothetical protein